MKAPAPTSAVRRAALCLGVAVTLGLTSMPGPAAERLPATNLMRHAAPDGARVAVTNLAGWEQRRRAILAGVAEVMGPLPGPEKRVPLAVRTEREEEGDGLIRRHLTYASEPGGRVPAILLMSRQASLAMERRHPAVLALHQTHPEGRRLVVGLAHSPDDEYGVALARRGFVVLAPAYPLWADYQPDLVALGWRSGTLKAVWDNQRGMDLLASLPFVQTNRGFGVIGHSLGGHNGIFTAVLDPRVTVVVSSCGLDSFLDYRGGDPAVWRVERGWCQTRYMPALAGYAGRLAEIPFDFPELIGALAPRVCLLSAPLHDTNFRCDSVRRLVEAARPVYQLHGAPGHLQAVHPDCGHRFPPDVREQAYQLLEQHLRATP